MKTITKLITILMVCILASTAILSADPNTDSLQKQLEEKNRQLKQTQNAINQAQSQKKTVSKQVADLDVKLSQAEQELETVEGQLTNLESQIVVTKRELDRASQNADGQQDLLKKRVRVMYEMGPVAYLSVILDATSFGDFVSRLDYLKKIVDYDLNLLQNMKVQRDNIAQKQSQLQSEMDEKEKLMKQMGDKRNEVASAKDERTKVLNDLVKDLKELNRQEDKLLEESKEIEKKIIASQSSSKYVGGTLEWPVPGYYKITSPYGYRIHPILKTKKLHTGIDISVPSGTSVHAANSGTVIFAGYYGGYGYAVIIDHGGKLSTLYAHNSKLLVSEGDKVKKGQVISKSGSTGLSTGPHLHFEVRKNGQHTNPMNYLGK